MFFMGTYTPKLDEKGRLFLPAKFRDELEEGLMVTRGQERCLTVYSLSQFELMAQRLQEASLTNKGTRDYVRMFSSGAFQESPDKHWNVLAALPQRRHMDREHVEPVIQIRTEPAL